jgi:hypothetical protein
MFRGASTRKAWPHKRWLRPSARSRVRLGAVIQRTNIMETTGIDPTAEI